MNKKYCYRKVNFPIDGYVAAVFWKSTDGEANLLHIMLPIYKNLKVVGKELRFFKKDMKNQKDSIEIYGALVVKIKFKRTSPLKKECWVTESETSLDYIYRTKQYVNVLKDENKLYQIMVMPACFDTKKRKWFLTNWLPVLPTVTDEELIKIAIMSTKTQVDPSAKDMALYTIEWIKGFDIDSGELFERESERSSTDAVC